VDISSEASAGENSRCFSQFVVRCGFGLSGRCVDRHHRCVHRQLRHPTRCAGIDVSGGANVIFRVITFYRAYWGCAANKIAEVGCAAPAWSSSVTAIVTPLMSSGPV
jgi:hypothetical protein